MQEGYFDYYELEPNNGCCLKCDNASPGCLCYECNCSKCYWYTPPHETFGEKGICDLVKELKEEGKKSTRRYYLRKQFEDFERSKILTEKSEKIYEELKKNEKIPNFYTCQRCKRNFCSREEFKIFLNKEPICDICSGKIELTKGDIERINEQIEIIIEEEYGRRR